MIRDLITNKTYEERANIKADEIAKVRHEGTFNKDGFTVEVQSLTKIEKGVEVLARAWKNGKQLGFGKDGSIDIERFRIINPPTQVYDPNGDIVIQKIDDVTGETYTRKLKENPVEAIRRCLIHTIKLVGKENSEIVSGKVGSTTTTAFPSFDASVRRLIAAGGEAWSSQRDGAGDSTSSAGTPDHTSRALVGTSGAGFYRALTRTAFIFDITAIPDTDTASSATLSLWGETLDNTFTPDGGNVSINIYQATIASDTAIANGDYATLNDNTTAFSTTLDITTANIGSYNNWVLNASGLTYINGRIAANDKARLTTNDSVHDIGGTDITNGTSGQTQTLLVSFSENAGTDQDPKLVIEHAAAAGASTRVRMLTGIGQ